MKKCPQKHIVLLPFTWSCFPCLFILLPGIQGILYWPVNWTQAKGKDFRKQFLQVSEQKRPPVQNKKETLKKMNVISRVITLCYSTCPGFVLASAAHIQSAQVSTQNNKTKASKEKRTMVHSKKKVIDDVPEEEQTLDILGKDLK